MAACPALLIEAFTSEPLSGNGAAVVRLEQAAEAPWMQGVANSLRQSETAFLWRAPEGPWQLRWFTPTCEVPLCGHATLASAHALMAELGVGGPLTFDTTGRVAYINDHMVELSAREHAVFDLGFL